MIGEKTEGGSAWHCHTVEEVVNLLGLKMSLPKDGLTTFEAAERLKKYGQNKLTEEVKKTLLQRIWTQVANVLVFILFTVAVVSTAQGILAIIQDDKDSLVPTWMQVGLIVMVVTLNTAIGIYQEGSAEAAAEALKSMLSSDARVVRDGVEKMIPSVEVVPGDVVTLGTGDKVPADIRVTKSTNLACLEAALTGESVPIDKVIEKIPVPDTGNPEQVPLGDRKNMCFSATLVASGSGQGIVISTGDYTQIGTINALVQQTEKKKTAVLEQIDVVSKYLAYFILVVGVTTFFVSLFYSKQDPLDAISTALTCAVAMIPEGLEAIVTMVYGWAVSNMADHNAIIRALPAVETLGSVTAICSDKTGTLTKNEMTVTAFVTSNARFRIELNATNRSSENFVRDDNFLTKRAEHQTGKSKNKIVEDGPNTSRPRRGHKELDNQFAVENLDMTTHEYANTIELGPSETEESVVMKGKSPGTSYIKNALAGGVLCSKCVLGENGTRKGEIGNPTELSILRAAYFGNVDVDGLKKESPIVAEVPFSSEYKFMATVHEPNKLIDGIGHNDKYVVYVKGAPDRMVKLCSKQAKSGMIGEKYSEPINKKYWLEQVAILSSHGLRVLALCRSMLPKAEIEEGSQLGPGFVNGRGKPWLTIVGLCAIMDPPRPECVHAIKEAHGAGVRVIMITGDHKDTALAIGHMLGIVDEEFTEAITGPELDQMTDESTKEAVMSHNVFARSSPENKIQIVKALQSVEQICSMTGDGVNDAPALKAANMGVAMGIEGTDVAREASDMILADDNFATIVYAVKEGRVVWDNLRKVLLVNTPINNAQGLSVLFGMVSGLSFPPLTPIQVLYSNLICAITLGFVCAVEPAEDGIMKNPPRRVGKRLIGRYLFLRIVIATISLTSFVVISVWWALHLGATNSQARSQAMTVLNFGGISVTLSARFTYNGSFHPRILIGNKFCWYSIVIVVFLQFAIIYIPGLNSSVFRMEGMSKKQWGIAVLFMVAQFTVMEIEKAIRRMLYKKGVNTDDYEVMPTSKELLAKHKKKDNNSFRPYVPGHDMSSFRSVDLPR